MMYENIRLEILKMKDEDQSDSYSQEKALERAKRLRKIIDKIGWPSKVLGVESVELASFLIVQHSNDLSFQEYCLSLIKKLPLDSWQRKQSVAYLTDRILIAKNMPQIYGTQFNGKEPFPIEDVVNLDKRRKDMELDLFSEYSDCMLKRYNN